MSQNTVTHDENSLKRIKQLDALLFFKNNKILSLLEEVVNQLLEEKPEDAVAYIVIVSIY